MILGSQVMPQGGYYHSSLQDITQATHEGPMVLGGDVSHTPTSGDKLSILVECSLSNPKPGRWPGELGIELTPSSTELRAVE